MTDAVLNNAGESPELPEMDWFQPCAGLVYVSVTGCRGNGEPDPQELVETVLDMISGFHVDTPNIPDVTGVVAEWTDEVKDFLAGGCISHPTGGPDFC